ncbi:MAG: RNA polymerase sigma factor [Spirochaetota bacterium]
MLDNKKISELYDKFSRELMIYIYSFIRSQESSEDILHDTFIRLLSHAKDDSIVDSNLRAMLYTIARNLCIDYIRKKSRNSETQLDENIEVSGNKVIDDLNAKYLQEKINDFIQNADPVSRSIFIMKKELSLTYESIAERLGISERTVKRKMRQISENLLEELKRCNFLN